MHKETNITNDDLASTLKIVMAHLFEGIDYYEELEKMETLLKKRHKGKRKLKLFLK